MGYIQQTTEYLQQWWGKLEEVNFKRELFNERVCIYKVSTDIEMFYLVKLLKSNGKEETEWKFYDWKLAYDKFSAL